MRVWFSTCSSLVAQLTRLRDAQGFCAERIPESVRDLLTIVFGLLATACAVLLVLALLTWRT